MKKAMHGTAIKTKRRRVVFSVLFVIAIAVGGGCQKWSALPPVMTDPFASVNTEPQPQASAEELVWGFRPEAAATAATGTNTGVRANTGARTTSGINKTEESLTYDKAAMTIYRLPQETNEDYIARWLEKSAEPSSTSETGNETAGTAGNTYARSYIPTPVPADPTAAAQVPSAAPTAAPPPPSPVPTTVATVSPETAAPTTAAPTTAAPTVAPDTRSEAYWIDRLLTLTNQARAEAGLPAVALGNPASLAAARVRAVETITRFSHTRPDERSCFTALTDEGLSFSMAGENLAAGYSSPESMFTAWMNSSGHRANILKSGYTCLAVGFQYASGSAYSYYGVQLFYTP